MKTLDQYIEEKREEFQEMYYRNVARYPSSDYFDFLEATIRDTARETVEACVPNKKPGFSLEIGQLDEKLGWNECRTTILSTAKEKGIIS